MPFVFPTLWLPKTDAAAVMPSQVTSSWASGDCAIASQSLDQLETAVNTISGTVYSGDFPAITGTQAFYTYGEFLSLTGTDTSGTRSQFTTGTFVVLTGTTTTGTLAQFQTATIQFLTGTSSSGTLKQAATGSFLVLTGSAASGTTALFQSATVQFLTATGLSGTTEAFQTITGTNVTGSVATFVTGTFVSLTATNFALPGSASFTTLTGTTTTGTTAIFTTITGTSIVHSGSVSGKLSSSLTTVAASYKTADVQTIANTTQPIINYNTKSLDTDNAVTTGSSWKFTLPPGKDGLYQVTAHTIITGTNLATAISQGALFKNGVVFRTGQTVQSMTSSVNEARSCGISAVVLLTGTDFIDYRVFQNNGSTWTLATTGSQGPANWIDIVRIPGS